MYFISIASYEQFVMINNNNNFIGHTGALGPHRVISNVFQKLFPRGQNGRTLTMTTLNPPLRQSLRQRCTTGAQIK
jgi:hypothetical protein